MSRSHNPPGTRRTVSLACGPPIGSHVVSLSLNNVYRPALSDIPARMAYSPPTFRRKKLTSIRPFVPIANQTSANRIVQHIFALGLGAFETANPVVKRSILPELVRRSQLMSDMRFPSRDPAIKIHVKFARRGEEMQVIRHDYIRADKPGCAFAPSSFVMPHAFADFAKQGRRDLVQTVVKTTVGSSGSSRTPFAGWLRSNIITIYINVPVSDCKRTILLGKAKRGRFETRRARAIHVVERQRNRYVSQSEGGTPGSQSGAYGVGYMNATWAGLFCPTSAVNRQKNFPAQHWPDGEIEGNINFTVALKVPFNLGTKQPAIIGLGIGRRTESAGIGTFLNRSG
jgi:hypothetical protein